MSDPYHIEDNWTTFCRFLIVSLAAVTALSSLVAGGCHGYLGAPGRHGLGQIEAAGKPGQPGVDDSK